MSVLGKEGSRGGLVLWYHNLDLLVVHDQADQGYPLYKPTNSKRPMDDVNVVGSDGTSTGKTNSGHRPRLWMLGTTTLAWQSSSHPEIS